MEDVLTELYEVVTQRHENPQEALIPATFLTRGSIKY